MNVLSYSYYAAVVTFQSYFLCCWQLSNIHLFRLLYSNEYIRGVYASEIIANYFNSYHLRILILTLQNGEM